MPSSGVGNEASIPLRAGEYLVISSAIALGMAVMVGVITGSPIGSIVAIVVVVGVAWYLPNRRAGKRIKQIQEQLPDVLAVMSASVEGGQTFQRAIDMYRRGPKRPLSAELDRVMAEVAVGSDLVVALENMAERSGVEDLKWAVEAVRIQQSTGGRLAPILHTLADFMRTRQEVRREVQTLSAEGRMSGYVPLRHSHLPRVRTGAQGSDVPHIPWSTGSGSWSSSGPPG